MNNPQSVRFNVSINKNYTDKVKPSDGRFWAFNMSFDTIETDAAGLLASIQRGWAWTAPHRKQQHRRPTKANPNYKTTYRVKENVIGGQLLALDFETEDYQSSLRGLRDNPFIEKYAAFTHTSASHTPARPRSRVVFTLDQKLTPGGLDIAMRAMVYAFPLADQSVKHSAVVLYGAKDCEADVLGNLLPTAVFNSEILAPYLAAIDAAREAIDAARAARAEAMKNAPQQSVDGQGDRYAQRIYKSEIRALATMQQGGGGVNRHGELLRISTRLASLAAANWHGLNTTHWEAAVMDACAANGYTADYGELSVIRALAFWGDAIPATPPAFKVQFRAGDTVTALLRGDGRALARGKIERMRQAPNTAHWEANINGAWYPREWLQHIPQGVTS